MSDSEFVDIQGLHIPIRPGFISSVFFIVFDIFTLGLVDVVLSHLSCFLYYRHIVAGKPIRVSSVDIPGITTYLVGTFFSFINVLSLGIKFAFIALVFIINLNIKSEIVRDSTPVTRTAAYIFDPSSQRWDTPKIRSVQRNIVGVKQCYLQDGPLISYYPVAFDLNDGLVLTSDEQDGTPSSGDVKYFINSTTMICLSPTFVINPVKPNVQVEGCSSFEAASCTEEKTVAVSSRLIDELRSFDPLTITIEEGIGSLKFKLVVYPEEAVQKTWPEYANPRLRCLHTNYGVQGDLSTRRSCILTSRNDSRTLVEQWTHNRNPDSSNGTFTRRFAGPVFAGPYDIADKMVASILRNLDLGNWLSLSSVLVSDAAIFEGRDGLHSFERLDGRRVVSVVQTEAVVLAAIALVAVLVGHLVVKQTIARDDRPRFNTINGMSSIVREESMPTGGSYVQGRGTVVGWTSRGANVVHFGPLRSVSESVAREKNNVII